MATSPAGERSPLDRIFLSLGVWGRWQKLQITLVMSLQSVAVYQLLSIVFIGYQPPFRCHSAGNVSNGSISADYNSSCSAVIFGLNGTYEARGCEDGYDYTVPKQSTIVAEWDLVCGDKFLSSLSQTLLIGGQAFGATFFSYLSDRLGRKRIFLLVQWAMLIISTATVFASGIIIFIMLRFLTGALQQGLIMLGTVLPLETTTTEYRSLVLLITGVVWGFFNGSLAVLGYAFRQQSWRYLQAVFCGTSLLLIIPNLIFLDESLRWLLANGRGREAQRILKKAAKMNKVKLSADDDLTMEVESILMKSDNGRVETDREALIGPGEEEEENQSVVVRPGKGVKYTCCDILTNSRLRRFIMVMFVVWIVSSFGYFGLSLASSELAGDRFLNFFLLAVVDTPAAIVSFFTMKWCGRRPTCLLFNGVAGLCMAVTICLTLLGTQAPGVVTAMAIIAKFGISASFGSLFIYTSELFPTTIRGLGCGMASSASRIGGMVAPFFTLWISTYPLLFPVVFGSGCVVVCGLVLLLPETRDKELPQTLDDIEQWFSTNSRTVRESKTNDRSDDINVKLLSDFD